MSCKTKENNILGYIELPEDYWIITSMADMYNPNFYWHNGEDNED